MNQTKNTRRPIILAIRGRGVAMMQRFDEYEKKQRFVKAVAVGLMEVREGKELELDEVKAKLGLE